MERGGEDVMSISGGGGWVEGILDFRWILCERGWGCGIGCDRMGVEMWDVGWIGK